MTENSTITEWKVATDVLVIGGGYYGLGADVKEAKANFRKVGGYLSDGYKIVTFGPAIKFVEVSSWGEVAWEILDGSPYDRNNPAHQPEVKHVKPRRRHA